MKRENVARHEFEYDEHLLNLTTFPKLLEALFYWLEFRYNLVQVDNREEPIKLRKKDSSEYTKTVLIFADTIKR